MHTQFKRCSYLGSSTTQLPSKVSASHRRTRRTCRSIDCTPLFQVQFASSFGSSFGSSFFCFSLGFTLCIPCVNLRFFSFFYFFLTVSSFTFVSAYWQTLVNVYLLSSVDDTTLPLRATCSPAFTPRCCSRLASCGSACSRHSGIQRVLNCARMAMFYLAFLFAFVIDGPWPCISVICEVNTAATCGLHTISDYHVLRFIVKYLTNWWSF